MRQDIPAPTPPVAPLNESEPTPPTSAISVPVPYGSAGQSHQSIPGKTHYHRYHPQKNKQDSGNQSAPPEKNGQ